MFVAYQQAMADHGAMDVDDLMLDCLRGYRSGMLQPLPVRYLLVDEFQDADAIQFDWLREYAKRGTTIQAVADDDQSIYGFRAGLGYEGLQRFACELNARLCFLDTNYRCAPGIVEVADRLIRGNRARMTKTLRSGAQVRATVAVRACHSTFEEADAIAERYTSVSGNAKTMAVLARANHWLDPIELVAISHGLAVCRSGGQRFLTRPHVAQVLGAIRFGLDPRERLALVSSLPACGLSVAATAAIETRLTARDRGGNLVDALYDSTLLAGLERGDATLLREFRQVLAEWAERCGSARAGAGGAVECKINLALRELLRHFMERSRNDWQRQDALTLSRVLTERLTGPLQQRLRTLEQWARRAKREARNDRPALALMSAHAAKGLEFDAVWVAGRNQRVFPYEGCEVEEERRLFYVALTRARSDLTLSYVMEKEREPSRFLAETGLVSLAAKGEAA